MPTASSPPEPRRRFGEHGLAWAFLLPSVVVFALFIIYPLGRTFYLSAHANDLFGAPSKYVGMKHYTDLLSSADFRTTLVTTALFVLFTVVPGVLGALLLVLLMEGRIRGVRFLRSAFALPFAFSVASASVVFSVFYNPASGVLNGLLSHVGLGPVGWLTDSQYALISIAVSTIWMNLGYNVLVLSAGIGSIPGEVLEAARLDGASGLRLARSITVPMLGPSLFFLVVISTVNALQSFGQIHILTKGGPDGSTRTLVYSVYEKAFAYGSSDFGTASAQAVVLMVVVLCCTAVQFGVLERKVHYA
ncbi:carbohydrate ABC transporter permease [Kitasatospora sp. CB01950]|uniref:carbohydrate ABC transporter permease n=1 Tax=Kitasatospora sp. CB01950 TaxID=1703930 RepID=UPI0009404016|nr:sugar ABC transporter permease [Kitasatospora sp. CB01950]OKJ10253.1 glycerol-3-phosphate ABC transporter permease [Kitasatospora sp. CB01950]